MEQILAPLRRVDWENVDDVERVSRHCLLALVGEPRSLRSALATLADCPRLLTLCEHYDILDKIVLWDDPSGMRVRLHVFLPGYFDRPHNHRWSYTSLILRGSYRHYLFGHHDNLKAGMDVSQLTPLMVRDESVGSIYTLNHRMVHAVMAEPYTVSLIVRGPAVKDRFLVIDRTTGKSWWQYGAALESPKTIQDKRMSRHQLEAARQQLRSLSLFGEC